MLEILYYPTEIKSANQFSILPGRSWAFFDRLTFHTVILEYFNIKE